MQESSACPCVASNTVVASHAGLVGGLGWQGAAWALQSDTAQLALLDRWAGSAPTALLFQRAAAARATAHAGLKELGDCSEEQLMRLDDLMADVRALDPTAGEDNALRQRLKQLEAYVWPVPLCLARSRGIRFCSRSARSRGSYRAGARVSTRPAGLPHPWGAASLTRDAHLPDREWSKRASGEKRELGVPRLSVPHRPSSRSTRLREAC